METMVANPPGHGDAMPSRLQPALDRRDADRRNLALIAGVACAVRIGLLIGYGPVLATDSRTYLDLAHRLGALHLSGYSGTRTPGYPALLLILGYSPRAAWIVQSVLGVLAALLLYRLVRRLGTGPRIALAAALFYAVDLEALALERLVLTETVAAFLLLLAASIAAELIARRAASRGPLILLGVTLACLCLVRPDMAAASGYLALVTGVLAARWSARRQGARVFAAVLVAPVVALVAWAGVNRATIGVTTVSTVIGHNMIDHIAPYVRAQPGRDFSVERAYVAARARRRTRTSDLSNLSGDAESAMERSSGLDAAHLNGRLLSIALGVIASHPIQYVASSVKQWPRFFLPPNYAYSFGSPVLRALWKLERAIKVGVALLFLLACALALVRRRARVLTPAAAALAGLVPVGLLVATFLAYGDTGRYGYVYWPVMLAVAVASTSPLRSLARRSGRC